MPSDSRELFKENAILALESHVLGGLPAHECAAALSVALPAAGDSEVEAISEALLGLALRSDGPADVRGLGPRILELVRPRPRIPARDVAIRALVANWSRVPLRIREGAVIGLGADLGTAIVSAAVTGGAKARLSVARAIGDALDPGVMGTAAGLLLDQDRRTADAAEEAVVRLASRAAGVPVPGAAGEWQPVNASRGALGVAERSEVRACVAAAAGGFESHRREGVMAAAMMLLDPGALAWGGRGDGLVKWFSDRGGAGHSSLRAMLRRSEGPLWRRRAWEWMSREVAAAAAVDRVARAGSLDEHEAVLSLGHLIANPARRWRLGLIQIRDGAKGRGPLPAREALASLSAGARRWVPALAGSCRTSAAGLERAVAPLLEDDDPAVRYAAMKALPAAAIGGCCSDPDVRVARSAALRVLHEAAGLGGAAASEGPAASPHAEVRRLAAAEARGPWDPRCPRSRMEARRRLAADRHGFVVSLRERLLGEPGGRAAAVMLVRALGLEADVELELLGLAAEPVAGGGGPRPGEVQAAAVGALGAVPSGSAADAVGACLEHPVDRVRASAVEAACRLWRGRERPMEAAVKERTADPNHRVRSTALRGILCAGHDAAAVAALREMLADNRPLHRLAGLWAAERVLVGPAGIREDPGMARWDSVAARVAEIARSEPEPPVRARAARCAAGLLARMRAGWSSRAVAVGGAVGA